MKKMKYRHPDLQKTGTTGRKAGRCSDIPYYVEDSPCGLSRFLDRLIGKIRPVCTEEIACSYWIYLYAQNNSRDLSSF